jgi:hypothetical protein
MQPGATLPQVHDSWTVVRDRKVTFKANDERLRSVLWRLFSPTKLRVTVDPLIEDMTVIFEMHDASYERVLHQILLQVAATFRIDGGVVSIERQGAKSKNGGLYKWGGPIYEEDKLTANLKLENRKLFLSKDKTVGGTFDLLQGAFVSAGFPPAHRYLYKRHGFALVSSCESVGQETPPGSRFLDKHLLMGYRLSCIEQLLYGRLRRELPRGTERGTYRVLVVTVSPSPEPVSNEVEVGIYYPAEVYNDLPHEFRKTVWKGNPTVTARVYELVGSAKTPRVTPVPPGEITMSVQDHLADAGLWRRKDIW